MKILVIGSGGREHALVWKLRQSSVVEDIWCTPGNAGIANDVECFPSDLNNPSQLADIASDLGADLTVVGPELPLVAGIADEFARRGLKIVGPSKAGALLEGSKIFAKQFMERHGIPTPGVRGICDSAADAYAAISVLNGAIVIKANGLCAGKGVLVTSAADEAKAFVARAMEQREFGDAGTQLLFEEAVTGSELSYIILTDGRSWWPLVSTRDHKRAYDRDRGPNTGGMGAYSDDGLLSPELERTIQQQIVEPTIRGLAAERRPYCGFIYFGLMLTSQGPKVLEYNCRLGDPETEAIVLRMDFDLAQALLACANGKLESFKPAWHAGASACVVLASEGYPEKPKVGRRITGLDDAVRGTGAVVFHAGTKRDGDGFYTNGGRVLIVAANGQTMSAATDKIYNAIDKIHFDGCHYRRDIGRPIRENNDPDRALSVGQEGL